MKSIVTVTSAMLLLLTAGVIWAVEAQPAVKAEQTTASKKQTLCPIMGGQINTNMFVDAEGKRVYFCCGGCPAEFKKDPAKFIKKMEADGITLDKAPAADPAKKPTTNAATTPATGCGEGCCK